MTAAAANDADADEPARKQTALRILSGGAANGLVTRLEPRFIREGGPGVEGDFGAVGMMRDRIVAGEAVDLIILTRALIDALSQSGHVVAGTARDLGAVVTGVAVRSGEAEPDISSGAALAQALAQAPTLYVPHTIESTAGRHVASVIDALGLSALYGPRLRQFANGQTAMAAMAEDGEEGAIGCTQITEILNTDGVTYVGDLPDQYGLKTVYTAAVSTRAVQPDAARTLIEILVDPAEQETRRAAGFA
ncbi:substrate-binding domain-containing protein [Oricola sp.]|uniref:molybdate ABC transporter substrate-binding protein n=1 Tax=Oricola sp. TaxID=1979950 RepID=UPI0025DEF078|nr:substrate-binding domain-containing protein [Oricola sp.]MCI5075848.1 substrate-binding domain-containing protein [Oricola sp.]